MSTDARFWVTEGLSREAYQTLSSGMPAARLWSLLLEVLSARAAARRPATLLEQWDRDRFVQPGLIDQRTMLDVERELLTAAADFESIELSPVAPLGVCSLMGHATQNRILSALRGTEVVSDPTNVMALECARRLRRDPLAAVRLATSHRCVRAQEIPKHPGFSAHFRMFSLASAGLERPNHDFVVNAIADHIRVMIDALDRLERIDLAFPDRRIAVLSTASRAGLGDRIAAAVQQQTVVRDMLDHGYYDGLRYQIAARANDGQHVPLIDGGAFDWLRRLTSNHKAVFVASGIGSQLVPLLFRRAAD